MKVLDLTSLLGQTSRKSRCFLSKRFDNDYSSRDESCPSCNGNKGASYPDKQWIMVVSRGLRYFLSMKFAECGESNA